ncbi:N-acetyltransferase [Bacillus taeanensis]|uniref:N-acetyltransferase n=2 Tax=Bacillus taeanensis TaxID=273032 RepID=A0A366Y004_9BACI|nr:N-acetyltransferase [Bacillus taeanensis]
MQFTAKDGANVILRPMKLEDAKGITLSIKDIVNKGEFIQKEQVRTIEEEHQFIRTIKKQGNMYTAVEVNGKVIGSSRIMIGELTMKKHTGVFRIWIHKEGRGKGIGKHLLQYSLNWAKEKGLHKLWLTVFSGNEVAVNAYKKAGFVVEGIQKEQVNIHGELQDEIYMAYFFN